MRNKKLILLGANNPQIIRLIEDINASTIDVNYEIIGWVDNDAAKIGKSYFGYIVLGKPDILTNYKDCFLVNNITTNAETRYETTQQLKNYKLDFETLIHPGINTHNVTIGSGVIIHESVILESNVEIDDFSVVCSGAIICHESKIGEYSFISSGVKIAGLVKVASQVTILIGATVTARVEVAQKTTISAGSVVFENTEPNTVIMGNPAKTIKKKVDEQIDLNFEEKLFEVLQKDFPKLLGIKKEEYFVDYDLLSSSDTFHLILLIEETFGINIADSDIKEENMGSVENILCFVKFKLKL